MARFSLPYSLIAAGCFAGAMAGCTMHRGPEGEKAMWSTVDNSLDKKSKLKEPSKTHIAYAQLQEQLGKLGDARHSYESALESDPQSVEATLGIARLDQLAGRDQQAEAGVQKALKAKPNDPLVLHAVGQFYASKQQWKKAGDSLSRATMAEPENVTYRYDFAVALARSGQFQQAMPHFIKCVGEPEAHYNLAYILYQQGKVDVAERHLVECLNQRPGLKQARTLLTEVRTMRKDREAIASNPAGTGKVAPVSHTVYSGPSRETPKPVPSSQITTRPKQQELPNWCVREFSEEQARIAEQAGQRPVKNSQPQSAPNTPGYSVPNAQRPAVPSPAASQNDQIEQWNNQTGVW